MSVCLKCGLTIIGSKAFFDKKIVNWKGGIQHKKKNRAVP